MLSYFVIPDITASHQETTFKLTLRVKLHGAAKIAGASQGIKDFRISITHTSSSATAVVLAIKGSS
jgi:phosphopantetheinyl transferase (holo-ACP synthase)